VPGENKRFFTVMGVLTLCAGIIFFLEASQRKLLVKEESFDFPTKLGEWVGEEIPVSRRTLEILESPFVVIRKYSNPEGEIVYFSGVFSSRNRKAIHPPEVCLTGGGVAAHKEVFNLKIGNKIYPTNKLVILPGKEKRPEEVILYWYKAGEKLFTNFYAQQLQMTWNQIRRKPFKGTDTALIRISTREIYGENQHNLEERLTNFAALLFKYLGVGDG